MSTMSIDQHVLNVNEYELIDSPDAFVEAIGALARRTESEGHPGVITYQFYVNRADNSAGAVIRYANADAWYEHHHMAYQWKEMPALQATVALKRLTLFGRLNDATEQWLADAGVSYTHYDTMAAGFVRESD